MPWFDPTTKTISEIRAHLESQPRGLCSLATRLEQDERAGARALAASVRRSVRLQRAEYARMRRLLKLERSLREQGARAIAGVDEAGRGPLAGPVVAAAVIIPEYVVIDGLNDSKALKPRVREALFDEIHARADSVSVGVCEPDEIDALNIYHATFEAMRRAIASLDPTPDRVLVDGNRLPESGFYELAVVKGDARSHTIAAASVVAKVTRDRRMVELDSAYPGYGFAGHKGYCCDEHIAALRCLGPCAAHRKSFHLDGFHTSAYLHLKSKIDSTTHPELIPALQHDLKQAKTALPPRAHKDLKDRLERLENGLNQAGERLAEAELQQRGYLILDRNVHLAGGEIDFIAQADDVIAFVEVKTNSQGDPSKLEDRVDTRKQAQITRLAEAYLAQHATTLTPRFDVVSVDLNGSAPDIHVFAGAFSG